MPPPRPSQRNVKAPAGQPAGERLMLPPSAGDAGTAAQAFDTFSYAVSHDLRAPLRAIEGYALALLEDFGQQLPPAAQAFVRRIQQATLTAEQRVDALLRLSRLSRGALRVGVVDLAAPLWHLVEDLRRHEPSRHVQCNVASPMLVTGDGTLLGIALENLVTNAWKFTRSRAEARIDIGVRQAGADVVVFVRDNGVGFDMAHAHRLFTPFQRLHAPDRFEGTGIGLASTRRIIERHGGRIWAEAAPEQGATFYFSLPGTPPDPDPDGA